MGQVFTFAHVGILEYRTSQNSTPRRYWTYKT